MSTEQTSRSSTVRAMLKFQAAFWGSVLAITILASLGHQSPDDDFNSNFIFILPFEWLAILTLVPAFVLAWLTLWKERLRLSKYFYLSIACIIGQPALLYLSLFVFVSD